MKIFMISNWGKVLLPKGQRDARRPEIAGYKYEYKQIGALKNSSIRKMQLLLLQSVLSRGFIPSTAAGIRFCNIKI